MRIKASPFDTALNDIIVEKETTNSSLPIQPIAGYNYSFSVIIASCSGDGKETVVQGKCVFERVGNIHLCVDIEYSTQSLEYTKMQILIHDKKYRVPGSMENRGSSIKEFHSLNQGWAINFSHMKNNKYIVEG